MVLVYTAVLKTTFKRIIIEEEQKIIKLNGDITELRQQLTEVTTKESRFLESQVKEIDERSQTLSEQTAPAVCQTDSGCNCFAHFFRGETVVAFDGHCLRSEGRTVGTSIKFARYYEDPQKPIEPEGWRFKHQRGYGFLKDSPPDAIIDPADIVIDPHPETDIAYVRGLFPHGLPNGHQPLELAGRPLSIGRPVFTFHRLDYTWTLEDQDGFSCLAVKKEGEILKFESGWYLETTKGNPNFSSYVFQTLPGNSGMPIFDLDGQVVAGDSEEDPKHRIRTRGVDWSFYVQFLGKNWNK
jgi:hypothetical protein